MKGSDSLTKKEKPKLTTRSLQASRWWAHKMVHFWKRRHTEMRATSGTSIDLISEESSSQKQSMAQRSWQAHQHHQALQASTTQRHGHGRGRAVSELINPDLQHSKWPGTQCSADNAIPLSILDPIKGSSCLYLHCTPLRITHLSLKRADELHSFYTDTGMGSSMGCETAASQLNSHHSPHSSPLFSVSGHCNTAAKATPMIFSEPSFTDAHSAKDTQDWDMILAQMLIFTAICAEMANCLSDSWAKGILKAWWM